MNLYSLNFFQNTFLNSKNKIYLNAIFVFCFTLITLFNILYFIAFRAENLNGVLFKASAISTGASFLLFLSSALFSIIGFTTKFVKFSNKRREFLKLSFNISFLIFIFSFLFKGFYNGIKKPFINRVDIKISNLKDDLSLAVLSDIHLGKYLGKSFLELLVDEVNKLNADALLIVGDMFDIKAKDLKDTLNPLNNLKIPCFFVLGNHEYYSGAYELIEVLKKYKVKVLENENLEFKGVNFAGVYDRAGQRFGYLKPNLKKALQNKNENLPTILLAHQPKYIYENVKDEVDLCICGHTHAGQIFPFSLLVLMEQKYLYGLYKEQDKQIYVSSGAGFWGPPVRILAPAEIAFLNLKKG
ncbi:metallophosphatase [Campylobacter blaseri]|uniref:Metallophosphatase n=2 Tax=Campylobacter blaseri TaxID=2042961 RepID=A0A2P8R039_9BACT|nr:metallophosphatase [Campylobacter blaseri]PSM53657.1 metallophosphatase [Campylobacter blaseri]